MVYVPYAQTLVRLTFKGVIKSSKRITTIVFLHLAYYLGIGVTAILGKMFRVTFLPDQPKRSSWVKHKRSNSMSTMY